MTSRRGRTGRMVAAALAVLLAACSGGGDDGAPEGGDPEQIVVVALGDSFTSGEGAPPYEPEAERCRRSTGAWPHLFARQEEVASIELRACAGARVEHLVGPWPSRGLGPQIPPEPDPEVTLVLLTVGGNDIGFGEIVATCVVLRCAPAPGSDALEDRLEELHEALADDLLPALAAAYPNARVAHVGYPRLSPPPEVDARCWWMSGDDQRISRGIVDALNDTIEDATSASDRAVYVDVSDAFAGHELCTSDPWVNAVGFGAGAAHPNAAGQQALADAVAAALAPATRS